MLRLNKYTVKKAAKKYGVKLTYPVDMFQVVALAEKVTGLAEPSEPYLEDACGLEFTKDDVTELTMREALGYVAAANGANLAANADGTAMVALYYGFYNVDAPYIYTTQDDTHELVDETGEYIVYYDEDSAAMFLQPPTWRNWIWARHCRRSLPLRSAGRTMTQRGRRRQRERQRPARHTQLTGRYPAAVSRWRTK